MVIIDGKQTSLSIRNRLKADISSAKERYGKDMGLAVILASDDLASEIYVKNKIKACEEVGVTSHLYKIVKSSSTEEIISLINTLNNDENINGILVQLPLFKHLDQAKILKSVSEEKDVDGFSAYQMGKLVIGEKQLVACTPLGIMELLEHYNICVKGLNAVVVGRSNIVGKPIAHLLLEKNATVTIAHSRTVNLSELTRKADLIVAAVGSAKLITADMVKEGAIVIDVGINRLEKGGICGDVDFENVKEKASFITPVPGGVGPMTITMLMSNTLKAYLMQNGK